MQSNLTPLQQKLIADLTQEFAKSNPKPSTGVKRFTVDSIAECNKDEQRFLDAVTKHNNAMIKLLVAQFDNEIKAFKKEFGKFLDIQFGYTSGLDWHTRDKWVEANKNAILEYRPCDEIYLYLVSKTKPYHGDYDRCYGKKYHELFVDFKRERLSHVLESGKQVMAYKIIGLVYSTRNYSHRENATTTGTLDELIQTDKRTQTEIVALAS